ncbi:hypothetical protein MLC52_02175 [Sulfurimonas sp. NW15]|uniref:hypothetical protein n=1 Tax=Sulfurimonas TaxID=202746 RepID=UPI001E4135F2|nr:hypothetical protein [Sulfurimonas hydrogeniphila]
MQDYLIVFIVLYMLLEFYEVQWQKAGTLMDMLARMYRYYHKNVLLFLIMHPTFYFAVWFLFYTHYNPYALALLSFKTADIVSKIIMIDQVFIKKEISKEFAQVLLTPIGPYLPYAGLLLYPFFIYMASV